MTPTLQPAPLPEGFACAVGPDGSADRSAGWQAAYTRLFAAVEVSLRDPSSWTGSLEADCCGSLQIAAERTGGTAVILRRADRTADRRSSVLLRHQLEGSAVVQQDGRTVRLSAGELAFIDTARPFRLVLGDCQRARILALPRALLRLAEPELRRLTATSVDAGRDTPAALFLDLLSGLVGRMPSAPPQEREGLARSAADTVALLALLTAGSQEAERECAAPSLLDRITAFIDSRLGDPDLTPQQIADRHGISLRYLHVLFRRSGTTVNSFVRTRRLEAARAELARPDAARRAVAAVAARWGFVSAAHFSRVFREAYGMSPVQWRSATRAATGDPVR